MELGRLCRHLNLNDHRYPCESKILNYAESRNMGLADFMALLQSLPKAEPEPKPQPRPEPKSEPMPLRDDNLYSFAERIVQRDKGKLWNYLKMPGNITAQKLHDYYLRNGGFSAILNDAALAQKAKGGRKTIRNR